MDIYRCQLKYIVNSVLLTGVTLITATQKETNVAHNVNTSLAYFLPLKKKLNSSIKPVITHSIPPI